MVRGRSIWGVVAILAIAVAGPTACGGGASVPASKLTVLRLPHGSYPRFVAFSRDGSLWVTEAHKAAVARLQPDGRLDQFSLHEPEDVPGDITVGPDGAMWMTGDLVTSRVDLDGNVDAPLKTVYAPAYGVPLAITAGPDGAVWMTSASTPARVIRVAGNGAAQTFKIPARGFEIDAHGIALGPEGTLWLTQEANEPWEASDAIDRLWPNGEFQRWPLPERRSGPLRITAGPDGALWFTEQKTYSIGRISTGGRISEFPLRPGIVPFDITTGPDGALWFTTRKQLGRITTAGSISLWAIPGAKELEGLAMAADGSAWIADPPADVVHHFNPKAN